MAGLDAGEVLIVLLLLAGVLWAVYNWTHSKDATSSK
jgi:hypothetical protein